MGKAKSDENDDAATHDSEKTTTAKKDKGAGGDKNAGSVTDSSSELEAVSPKKGEPSDNLRRRAEWFQKRH